VLVLHREQRTEFDCERGRDSCEHVDSCPSACLKLAQAALERVAKRMDDATIRDHCYAGIGDRELRDTRSRQRLEHVARRHPCGK